MHCTCSISGDSSKYTFISRKIIVTLKELHDLLKSAGIAGFCNPVYTRIARSFAWPGNIVEIIEEHADSICAIEDWTNRSVRASSISKGRFKDEEFSVVLECAHEEIGNVASLKPASSAYGVVLKALSTDQFLGDVVKMNGDNNTSFVECFNSVAIKYRPKRKF
uniref:Uncharacterized protein n=1 Tax=Ditylenchus dipsaci TaxID=166011 RepID=A0A915CXG2_9BILA